MRLSEKIKNENINVSIDYLYLIKVLEELTNSIDELSKIMKNKG